MLCFLQRPGEVTILEKSDGVGGRTRVFEKDGYKYDNGPTFFHYPEIARRFSPLSGRMLMKI